MLVHLAIRGPVWICRAICIASTHRTYDISRTGRRRSGRASSAEGKIPARYMVASKHTAMIEHRPSCNSWTTLPGWIIRCPSRLNLSGSDPQQSAWIRNTMRISHDLNHLSKLTVCWAEGVWCHQQKKAQSKVKWGGSSRRLSWTTSEGRRGSKS